MAQLAYFETLSEMRDAMRIEHLREDEMWNRVALDAANQRAVKTAVNMLVAGFPVDKIAQCTELPLAVVEGLEAERANAQPPMQ